jgi:hypothetical protein
MRNMALGAQWRIIEGCAMKKAFLACLVLLAGCNNEAQYTRVVAAHDAADDARRKASWEKFYSQMAADNLKYQTTVTALRTVQVGDAYEEFTAKILPARQKGSGCLIYEGQDSTPSVRVERYHIYPKDRQEWFIVYIRDNHIVDYLAVGFKK